ncbi:hypothetical protein E4U43_002540 [Claviceps pusilla]|uniref:DUF7896 domain-containing protein n=1 Tax=Claviceps pusilla TaxID=123648 RepID=A0A9P7N6I6_9HYPO|nr:hypothetical protein E4U43_002540 [Claviceps pusilla]
MSRHSSLGINPLCHDAGTSSPSPCIPGQMPTFAGDAFLGPSPGPNLLPCLDQNGNAPDVGVHPGSYLLAKDGSGEQSYLPCARAYPPFDRLSGSILPLTPPSMVSGLSLTPFDTSQPLSRQSSAFDFGNGVSMTRHPSSQSFQNGGVSLQDSSLRVEQNTPCARSPTSDPELHFMGSGLVSSHAYAAPPFDFTMFPSPSGDQLMQRSGSNLSFASAWSSPSGVQHPPRETGTNLLENHTATNIRPNFADTLSLPTASQSNLARRTQRRFRIPRPPYRRPRGPKVFCTHCNDQPEGFRGEHELRRHINARHSHVVRKYVCRDPASVGLVSTVSLIQPLSECKACTSGKAYGTDYNAAAHLRRTHFRSKPLRGRNKRPGDERRGGNGGGSWPPMCELKPWIMEVSVACAEDDAAAAAPTISPVQLDDGANHDNHVMALVAGDDVSHPPDFYNPTSFVDDATYGVTAWTETGCTLDQFLAPFDFSAENQVFPGAINNE